MRKNITKLEFKCFICKVHKLRLSNNGQNCYQNRSSVIWVLLFAKPCDYPNTWRYWWNIAKVRLNGAPCGITCYKNKTFMLFINYIHLLNATKFMGTMLIFIIYCNLWLLQRHACICATFPYRTVMKWGLSLVRNARGQHWQRGIYSLSRICMAVWIMKAHIYSNDKNK